MSAVVSVACGDGGDTVAVESPTTTTTAHTEISLDALSDDYCERAGELSGAGMLRLDNDPGRAAASMDALAAVAPADLADDFEVVGEQLAAFGELDTADGTAVLTVIDLLVDPEFLGALDRIERTTLEQCGVRLDAGVDDDSD